MKLILDTNILISSLIKDSIIRKVIIESEWTFFYPAVALEEVEKYKQLIIRKSGLTEFEYRELLTRRTSYINLIQQDDLSSFMNEADQLLGKIDKDDVVFIAAALSTDNDGIWSDDLHFQKQNKIKVWRTIDILTLINKHIRNDK